MLPVQEAATVEMRDVEDRLGKLRGGLRKWSKPITVCKDVGMAKTDEESMLACHDMARRNFADLEALHANAIKSLQRTSWYLNEQFNAEKPAAVLSTVAGVTEEVRKALKDV